MAYACSGSQRVRVRGSACVCLCVFVQGDADRPAGRPPSSACTQQGSQGAVHQLRALTSSTGALNASSSWCSVAGASEAEQERMARSGGGDAAG